TPFKRAAARMFYSVFGKSAGLSMDNASDFKLLDRSVVSLLTKMPERATFFRAMASWTGLPSTKVYYEVGERAGGKTKWSPFGLMRLAFNSIASYSTAPLQIVTFTGVIFLIFAVILGVQSLYRKFTGSSLEGFTTVILLLLIIGSVLMISLGVIGAYIAKIYEEVKYRPRYIVAESVGAMYGRRD
ncbi:MAG: glycosyltransferase, partial [Defluviitaleaceae bacterium]|nr:glycosyltransferase [Defluviitaleaceae bacterium]